MDGSIQPLPHESLVPQPKPREGARRRREREDREPGTPSPEEPPSVAGAAAGPAAHDEAHPPCEEGVGRRLDVTA